MLSTDIFFASGAAAILRFIGYRTALQQFFTPVNDRQDDRPQQPIGNEYHPGKLDGQMKDADYQI